MEIQSGSYEGQSGHSSVLFIPEERFIKRLISVIKERSIMSCVVETNYVTVEHSVDARGFHWGSFSYCGVPHLENEATLGGLKRRLDIIIGCGAYELVEKDR